MSDAADEAEPAEDSIPIRVRGIYTTALTQLFDSAGHEVVQASPPIRRRFETTFDRAPYHVDVATTDERQGVGVHGTPASVAAVRDLLTDVGIDAMAWDDPIPRGAIYRGRVTETLGNGAVVALGVDADGGHDGEGYLPFSETEGYVEEGDEFTVRVEAATPPWDDDRPNLTTEIRASGGLATLVRGRSETRVRGGDDAAARELAGMTDLLDTDVPDGWGIEWNRAAPEADLDALGDSLDRASERAVAIDDALAEFDESDDTEDEVGELIAPDATTWVWFGRESRFALDEHRREVATTMPGHHRTKAASRAASGGVDFAEALSSFEDTDPEAFPFAVVTDQFGPVEGDRVGIGHGKPDGRLISLGRGEVTAREEDGTVTVERSMSAGGTYDALGVEREHGDIAVTKFREGRWWYPTVYRDAEGERKGTYVNICTPVEVFPKSMRYVDLHVDVVKHRDGTVERVDDDELDAAVEAGLLRPETAEKARAVAAGVERALRD